MHFLFTIFNDNLYAFSQSETFINSLLSTEQLTVFARVLDE